MEVHRILGPGLLEAVYHEALGIEFDLQSISFESEPKIRLSYKGRELKKYYEPDFLVFAEVVLEIKAQTTLTKIDEAQIINSPICTGKKTGLLVNFGELSLQWKRFVN